MNLRSEWIIAALIAVCLGCGSAPDPETQTKTETPIPEKLKVDLDRKPRREPPKIQPSNVAEDIDAPKIAQIRLKGTKWRGNVPIGPGYRPESADKPEPPELELTITSESAWTMYFPYGEGQRTTGTLEREGRVVVFRVVTFNGKPATGDNAVTQRYVLSKDGKQMVNEAGSQLVFRRTN
ncbi:MAG TPA: hypothetical protein PLH94_07760 [Fimbriimonadaceae bacterium]|nr:hypothetical protein [Fimbriimonadaceae bacterium]